MVQQLSKRIECVFSFQEFFSHLLDSRSFIYNILQQELHSQLNKYLFQTLLLTISIIPLSSCIKKNVLRNLILCCSLHASPFTHISPVNLAGNFFFSRWRIVFGLFPVQNLNVALWGERQQKTRRQSRWTLLQKGQLCALWDKWHYKPNENKPFCP